ncbi:MAG: DUF2818 family protein [Pseudomonadota bacterium]
MNGLVPAWAVISVLVVALVAANLPFVNQRLFLVGPSRQPKPTFWHVLELLVYAVLVAVLGRALESHVGQAAPQRWEFYAIWGCVFLTLAFPGFVWRYLRRGARR